MEKYEAINTRMSPLCQQVSQFPLIQLVFVHRLKPNRIVNGQF